MENAILKLGKEMSVQNRGIEYHENMLNQFVENGYEVYHEEVTLENWFETTEYRKVHKIFFQKDYSSQPSFFFVVNKIKRFLIKEDREHDEELNLILNVGLKEVMTSYFAIDVKITMNAEMIPSEVMKKSKPVLGISYVLLNRKE